MHIACCGFVSNCMVDVVDSGLMLSNRKYFAVINKAFRALTCVEVNCYSISKNVNTTDLFTENVFFFVQQSLLCLSYTQ